MNISVIIPNFNGSKFLPDCLDNLLTSIKSCPGSQFELILVDNGSTDNSQAIFSDFYLHHHLPHQLISLKHNHGFACAVNRGIKQAKYPYVCLLNNDVTLSPDWFKLITSASANDNQNTAAFCGTVLNKNGSQFESQGLQFEIRGKCLNINNHRPFSPTDISNQVPYYIWGSSAAIVIYNKYIIQKIGLFDESFFAYEEDVDLAFRLSRLGFKTLYVPQALANHLGGGTSSQMGNFRYRMDFKNWHLLILKNYSFKEITVNFVSIIIERCRNLSGLFKSTIVTYRFQTIYFFPYFVVSIYFEILFRIPSIVQKRVFFFNLKRQLLK